MTICSHLCFPAPCCSGRDSVLILNYTACPSGLVETLLHCPPASLLCLQTLSQRAYSHQYLNILKSLLLLKQSKSEENCCDAPFTSISCLILWLIFTAKPFQRQVRSSCLYFLISGLLFSILLSGFSLAYSKSLVTSLLRSPVDASQSFSYLTSW